MASAKLSITVKQHQIRVHTFPACIQQPPPIRADRQIWKVPGARVLNGTNGYRRCFESEEFHWLATIALSSPIAEEDALLRKRPPFKPWTVQHLVLFAAVGQVTWRRL